jgi:site-specific DNA-cytosine methylase
VRTLELFAGIGGLHAACPWLDVVHAVDINRDGQSVYRANFDTPYLIRELETIPLAWLAEQHADLWWMSPPCTPFTRRGRQRDMDDVRTRSLLHLIDAVAEIRPLHAVVENVVGFESSRTLERLFQRWSAVGYDVLVDRRCPSDRGWPNRRPRVYVLASRQVGSRPMGPQIEAFCRTLPERKLPASHTETASRSPTLASLIDTSIAPDSHSELWLGSSIADAYRRSLDRVKSEDPGAVTACFGSSYGRAITGSGSYLETEHGLRRFAPREMARLLGFSDSFAWPDTLKTHRLWQLLGNSLSLPVVSQVLDFTRPWNHPPRFAPNLSNSD